jgi:hypothetical protein
MNFPPPGLLFHAALVASLPISAPLTAQVQLLAASHGGVYLDIPLIAPIAS